MESEKLEAFEFDVKINGVEEAIAKAEELTNKIKEARTLAGELALMLDKLEVEV
jgi:hypothetical protein